MIIDNHTDSWSSARDDFQHNTLPKLRAIGKQIGKSASSGNATAKGVIAYYSMLHKSFDPMTLIFLQKAIEDYEKESIKV